MAAVPERSASLGEEALFAFLEECMVGAGAPAPLREQADAVTRVLELANDDWPEPEAVRELLLLAQGDRPALERTQRVLQGGLLRTMLPNLMAIRASRLVHAALRQSRASDRW